MEATPSPSRPAPEPSQIDPARAAEQRKAVITISIVGIVILVLIVLSVVFLLRTDIATTGRIRDIFIIFMALESLVIGVALIILVIQLATLINLLQNEVKPILNSTNETVSTLRGTVTFLSDNLVQPVIKLNEYLAGIKRLIDLARPPKR